MKAKCPYCDDGCARCDGGHYEVSIAEGAMYTITCLDPKCGFQNGTRISGPGLPDMPPQGLDDWGRVLECVVCEHAAEWELIGWSGPPKGEEEEE